MKLFFEQLSGHPVPSSNHPQSKISLSCLSETSSILIFPKKSLSLPSVHPSIKYLSLLIRFPEHYYLQAVCRLCPKACCWLLVNFFISVCEVFFSFPVPNCISVNQPPAHTAGWGCSWQVQDFAFPHVEFFEVSQARFFSLLRSS